MFRSLHEKSRMILGGCLIVWLFLGGVREVMGESAKGTWDSRFTLPPGLNGPVEAMLPLGGFLIVGGAFTKAGDVEAHNLALWDGSRWWPLGGGVDGSVFALALGNDGLYVGGGFTHAGGIPANNIAKWNGVSWDAMGGGVQEKYLGTLSVYGLCVQGSSVYVGGVFSQAGNIETQNIARWDGHAWHSLGGGVGFYNPPEPYAPPSVVYSLVGDGTRIYVGGIFRYAGNIATTNLACWNGQNWKGIGSPAGGVSSIGVDVHHFTAL